MPGSVMAWPLSGTMRRSASGQARCRSQAIDDRRADVVAAVDDDAGDMADQPGIGDQLAVALEEAAVDEVVALDPGEGDGVVRLAEGGDARRIGEEGKRRALPHAPGARAPRARMSASSPVRRLW